MLKAYNNLNTFLTETLETSDQLAKVTDDLSSYDTPYRMTLESSGQMEIIEVVGYDNSNLIIERGKESTTPKEWQAGIELQHRGTAGQYDGLVNGIDNKAESRDLTQLQLNYLELLIQRELDNEARAGDAGYWWDGLTNQDKIDTLDNLELDNQQLILENEKENGEAVWNTYDIDFITDRIRYFQDRSISDRVTAESALEGENELTIQLAEVTITEVE